MASLRESELVSEAEAMEDYDYAQEDWSPSGEDNFKVGAPAAACHVRTLQTAPSQQAEASASWAWAGTEFAMLEGSQPWPAEGHWRGGTEAEGQGRKQLAVTGHVHVRWTPCNATMLQATWRNTQHIH